MHGPIALPHSHSHALHVSLCLTCTLTHSSRSWVPGIRYIAFRCHASRCARERVQQSKQAPTNHMTTRSLSLLTHKIVRNTFSLMNWLSGLFYYLYNQEWKKMFSTDLGQYHFIMPFYYIALTSFIKKEKECQLIFIPVLSNTQH